MLLLLGLLLRLGPLIVALIVALALVLVRETRANRVRGL